MQELFTWRFTSGSTAKAILVDESVPLGESLARIDLCPSYPTVVLVGGASNVAPEDLENLRARFFSVLAPLAQRLRAIVVDGGTNSGVMGLMGQARASIGGTFPLVGVLPEGKILKPGAASAIEKLETNHTHFVLSPGKQWGEESPWLARVGTVLAGSAPSLTLLVNGGEVAWQDVAASLEQKRPVVAIAGSGRIADSIAEAMRGGSPQDERAKGLAASGLVRVLDLNSGAEALARGLQRLLEGREQA